MKQKNVLLLSLIALALLGLALAAWQAGADTSSGNWQKPVFQASAATATLTPTPGWWETPLERPVVPTMPGKKPTSETPRP